MTSYNFNFGDVPAHSKNVWHAPPARAREESYAARQKRLGRYIDVDSPLAAERIFNAVRRAAGANPKIDVQHAATIAQGLLKGVSEDEQQVLLEAIVTNPASSAAAQTISDESIQLEKQQELTRAILREAEAALDAEKNRRDDIIKIAKTRNKGSAEAIAAFIFLVGGGDKLQSAIAAWAAAQERSDGGAETSESRRAGGDEESRAVSLANYTAYEYSANGLLERKNYAPSSPAAALDVPYGQGTPETPAWTPQQEKYTPQRPVQNYDEHGTPKGLVIPNAPGEVIEGQTQSPVFRDKQGRIIRRDGTIVGEPDSSKAPDQPQAPKQSLKPETEKKGVLGLPKGNLPGPMSKIPQSRATTPEIQVPEVSAPEHAPGQEHDIITGMPLGGAQPQGVEQKGVEQKSDAQREAEREAERAANERAEKVWKGEVKPKTWSETFKSWMGYLSGAQQPAAPAQTPEAKRDAPDFIPPELPFKVPIGQVPDDLKAKVPEVAKEPEITIPEPPIKIPLGALPPELTKPAEVAKAPEKQGTIAEPNKVTGTGTNLPKGWIEGEGLPTEGGNLRVIVNPQTKERIVYDYDGKTPISNEMFGGSDKDGYKTLSPEVAKARIEAERAVASQEKGNVAPSKITAPDSKTPIPDKDIKLEAVRPADPVASKIPQVEEFRIPKPGQKPSFEMGGVKLYDVDGYTATQKPDGSWVNTITKNGVLRSQETNKDGTITIEEVTNGKKRVFTYDQNGKLIAAPQGVKADTQTPTALAPNKAADDATKTSVPGVKRNADGSLEIDITRGVKTPDAKAPDDKTAGKTPEKTTSIVLPELIVEPTGDHKAPAKTSSVPLPMSRPGRNMSLAALGGNKREGSTAELEAEKAKKKLEEMKAASLTPAATTTELMKTIAGNAPPIIAATESKLANPSGTPDPAKNDAVAANAAPAASQPGAAAAKPEEQKVAAAAKPQAPKMSA